MPSILVVNARSDIRLSISVILAPLKHTILQATDIVCAEELLLENSIPPQTIACIIIDIDFSPSSQIAKNTWKFVQTVKHANMAPVIALTQWHQASVIDKALNEGVDAFVSKPWRNQKLLIDVSKAIVHHQEQQQQGQLIKHVNSRNNHYYAWLSVSMQKVYRQVNSVQDKQSIMLISGDISSGKKSLARYIHQESSRQKAPFITFNCLQCIRDETSFPWEMPLAFVKDGTLMIEAIDCLSMAQQKSLAGWLIQQKDDASIRLRVVLSSYQVLSVLHKSKAIYEGLYRLLKIHEIRLPSLHARTEDISPLAIYFTQHTLSTYAAEYSLHADAIKRLKTYHWPLNLKEFQQVIEQAVLQAQQGAIKNNENQLVQNIEIQAQHIVLPSFAPLDDQEIPLPLMTLEQTEISLIKQALQETQFNTPKAAALLGLTKSSMYRRVEKYGLAQK